MNDNEAEMLELGHRPCYIPWNRISIQPNGDVYPCAVAHVPVGNMFEQRLDDIWNGERLADFRAGVNDNDRMNDDCRQCMHCRQSSDPRRGCQRSVGRPGIRDRNDAEITTLTSFRDNLELTQPGNAFRHN